MRILALPKFSDRNPYTSLLYTAVENLGVEVVEFDPRAGSPSKGDLLHVHWPDWFLGRRNPIAVMRECATWIDGLRALKSNGTKLVWTVHNLHSHEARHGLAQKKLWKEFVPMVDGCICLSDVSMTLVRKQFPALTCPATTVPHGHYRDVYPNTVSREDARRKLGISPSTFVFVHVGMVRGYKNVPELIQAFRGVEGDVALLIAGEVFDEGLKRRIEAATEEEGRVRLSLKRVGDEELQDYFNAADVAVFPYRDILNSGSALMALSFDTPVLVPAIGSMPELRETIGPDWVRTYNGPFGTRALKDAMKWATEVARPLRAPLNQLDWSVLAKKTVKFYSQVLGS